MFAQMIKIALINHLAGIISKQEAE